MEEARIADRARETGAYFTAALEQLKTRHSRIVEVRGRGLLLGIQLDGPADDLVSVCLQKGFLINCVQGDTLRFVPPLIIHHEHIDQLIDCLDEVLVR
jgi:acetylornithine/succinyldiaminopimelate/putrescine aminotransferase